MLNPMKWFQKKPKAKMPSNFILVRWTEDSGILNIPQKVVEIHWHDMVYEHPFRSKQQVRDFERKLHCPSMDMTSGRSKPHFEVFKKLHPDIVEMDRF